MVRKDIIINVVGLGYIGLPTALSMSCNYKVIGTDYDDIVVDKLISGDVSFTENGMQELYEKAINSGIQFTTEYMRADVYVVAVPTPYIKENKKIDASYVVEAVKSVLNVCNDGCIIVIESTISPDTIDKYIRPLVGTRNVYLAHAPERIIPGKIITELRSNSRTIGADFDWVAQDIKEIYASFCKGEIVTTDIRTAEMTKVVENTYRDINIAFANELTKICRNAGLDIYEIIRIANKHPRVNILSPGPGVGGHCISVDPWFLVGDYPGLANIILAARKINDSMPEFVLERTHEIMEQNNITNLDKVGFYGLTYKENVDDVRESPTLQLLECMKKHLCPSVKVYDPYVKNKIVDNQFFDLDMFLNNIELIVIMVGHDEIIENKQKIKNKVIFDTRNIIDFDTVYHL